MAEIWTRLLRPLRARAARFAFGDPSCLTGPHGCLRTGASFVAWNQIEGDYLEFGVYRGESFAAAYHALDGSRREHARSGFDSSEYREWLVNPPRLFAFDSFLGLPEGSGERHVDYAAGAYRCTEREFRARIEGSGVDPERVVAVPGFYQQTLNQATKEKHGMRKVAMAMIDCDLYESTVPVLDFLTDLVGQGTILIFHDWFRFKGRTDCGEQRACREWLDRNPDLELIEYWREGPQAVSFLVNLKRSARR
jgi:O-methyltransferase